MSYEDLEEARAKRVEKDAIQEAKRQAKRGRKPKNKPPEVEEGAEDTVRRSKKRKIASQEASPSNKVARVSKAQVPIPAAALVPQMSGTSVAEDQIEPEWSAPVARMY